MSHHGQIKDVDNGPTIRDHVSNTRYKQQMVRPSSLTQAMVVQHPPESVSPGNNNRPEQCDHLTCQRMDSWIFDLLVDDFRAPKNRRAPRDLSRDNVNTLWEASTEQRFSSSEHVHACLKTFCRCLGLAEFRIQKHWKYSNATGSRIPSKDWFDSTLAGIQVTPGMFL